MKEYKYKINGNEYNVAIIDIDENTAAVEVNGVSYKVDILSDDVVYSSRKIIPSNNSETSKPNEEFTPNKEINNTKVEEVKKEDTPNASVKGKAIQSPLPGVIIDVKVKVGDNVKAGQTVAILEAMKMENAINAETDGVVTGVKVNKGDSILEGSDIVIIG